jgi:hypothetical protein
VFSDGDERAEAFAENSFETVGVHAAFFPPPDGKNHLQPE